MFITLPPFEFRTPPGTVDQGARRWRLMQLNLHVPWFLLSIETKDLESEVGHIQTICFAWEIDLLAFLPTVDHATVTALVCMAPGWTSASGSWTSHAVHEVWQVDTIDGHYLILRGADGQDLDVGLPTDPTSHETKRTLLLEINQQCHRVARPRLS